MQALDLPNLRDAPFRLGVGPDEAVPHRSWRALHSGVLAALEDGPARIALLGPAGSGKTLLLHALASALQERGRAARVAGAGTLPADLPRDAILLVDDADRLGGDALARLAERDEACVLAGMPALADRLPAQFAAMTLEPLAPDEVARFVAARLAAAGQRRDLLDPDAVLTLSQRSAGVPRQVNALAGAAVFLAGLDGAGGVGRRHVEEAAAMRDGADLDTGAAPVPTDPEPAGVAAPDPVPPAKTPAEPLTPRRSRRPKPAMVMAGAATGLLLLVGAVLAIHPGGGARPERESRAVPVAPAVPAVPQQQAATPQQDPTAPLPASPSKPPAVDGQAAASPGPAVAAPMPRRANPSREPLPSTPESAVASGPRVVLHYHDGGAAEADRLAALLTGQGSRFGRIETRAVPGTPRAATIRFFHPEDVGAAWELEAALRATGDDWQVRNFTSYHPRPRRGTLEVWIR